MFGFFKKNKEEKQEITLDHPLMGKLTFDNQWYGKFNCRLFGIEKEITLVIYLDDEEPDDPLDKQETAYRYYLDNLDKVNSKIEAELRYAFELDDDFVLSSRFEPSKFIIYQDSSCGISFRDHKESEYSAANYVVVSVRPRVIFEGSEHDYYGL